MSDDKPKRPRPGKGDERAPRRTKTTFDETRRDDAPNKSREARPPRAAGARDERRPRDEARRDERPQARRFDKERPGAPRAASLGKTRYGAEEPRSRESTGGQAPLKRKAAAGGARKSAPTAAPREKAFEGERIAKVMARAGACSRRDAEQWIAAGRVAVNGRVLESAAFNVREGDQITVDGAPLAERERTRLFLFHKPAGLVTSAKDPEGRETVFAYLQDKHEDLPRVVSVGRLDINTEGLLLLSNDGGLARTLELPATGWTRRYRVRIHGEVDQAQLDALSRGVSVEGVDYAPIEARLDRVQGANAWLTMSLSEGKNREIKRVLEHLGLAVTRLIRISFGPFQLGDLAEGAVEEVRLKILREQLGKSIAELAGVDFASPLRDEPTPTESQEKRKAAEKRPRKHVSTLRKQRDERAETGPRARIERGMTADRKGRAVAVERVVVKGEKPAEGTRNARRFAAARRGEDGESHEKRFERPRKPESLREESGSRREGARRTAERAPRFERQRGRAAEREDARIHPRESATGAREPRRHEGPPPPQRERHAGFERNGPRRERSEGGERRSDRGFERPPRRDGAEAGRGASRKPRGEGFAGDRPRAPRSEGAERPRERSRQGDRPERSREAPRPDRNRGDARGERPRERAYEGRTRDGGGAKLDRPRKPRSDGAPRNGGPPRGKPPKGGPRKPRQT